MTKLKFNKDSSNGAAVSKDCKWNAECNRNKRDVSKKRRRNHSENENMQNMDKSISSDGEESRGKSKLPAGYNKKRTLTKRKKERAESRDPKNILRERKEEKRLKEEEERKRRQKLEADIKLKAEENYQQEALSRTLQIDNDTSRESDIGVLTEKSPSKYDAKVISEKSIGNTPNTANSVIEETNNDGGKIEDERKLVERLKCISQKKIATENLTKMIGIWMIDTHKVDESENSRTNETKLGSAEMTQRMNGGNQSVSAKENGSVFEFDDEPLNEKEGWATVARRGTSQRYEELKAKFQKFCSLQARK